MYFLFANEIADVDPNEFEKIGHFQPGVYTAPCVRLDLGIKGQKTWCKDKVEDCQHTIHFLYEPDESVNLLPTRDFSPGTVYRRKGIHYVELLHEIQLSSVVQTHLYFLVRMLDCRFAVMQFGMLQELDEIDLWDKDLIR